MYDKRLDAIVKAAELGSFSKAAQEMDYSVPALIKQISSFESQMGVKIFERSNKGVNLTAVGREFVEDAKDLIMRSNQILEKAARTQSISDNLVRVGVSLYQSGQRILELCQNLYLHGTSLVIQFVPVGDTYESYKYTIEHLGEEVDVFGSTRLDEEDERSANLAIVGNPNLCIGAALKDELAAFDTIEVSALAGRRIHIQRRGNPYIDSARAEIAERATGVEFVEFPRYTMSVFDTCANSDDLLLTKEIWRGVHPLLKTIDVKWNRTMPYCLYYAKNPRPAALKFISSIKALIDESDGRANEASALISGKSIWPSASPLT